MVAQWTYGLNKRLGLTLLSYQIFKKTLLVDTDVLTQKKKEERYSGLDIIAGRM